MSGALAQPRPTGASPLIRKENLTARTDWFLLWIG